MSLKSFRLNWANSIELFRCFLDLFALFFGKGLRYASGQSEGRMDLSSPEHADDVHGPAPGLDHLRADLHAHFVDHAQYVPLGHRRVGTHDEVGSAQDVEVDGVVRNVEGGVEELPELFCRRRGIDVEDGVAGLRRGEVMRLGADAADAGGDVRQFFNAPALGEFLEPPKLGNDHIGVCHLSLIVEEEVDPSMSFEAGHGINSDLLHRILLIP